MAFAYPCLGDGYKIHVHLSQVIGEYIGLVTNLTSIDNAQFDRCLDTADSTHVVGRRLGGYNIPGNRRNRGDQLCKICPVNTCLSADRLNLSLIVPSAVHGGNWPKTPCSGFRSSSGRWSAVGTSSASLLLPSTVGSAPAVSRE